MSGLTIPASVDVHLNWDYESEHPRIRRLYDEGIHRQWNERTDIDWALPAVSGDEESSTFGRAAFESSPLGRYGPQLWRRFRQEQQAWMVGQFLHGEQSALVVSARLAEVLPDLAAKAYAASQAAEEARHVHVFARYAAERLTERYPVSPAFEQLLEQMLRDRQWDVQVLGMHVMIESLALGAFRLAATTFEDPLIRQITHFAARDEARHVSFGVLVLDSVYSTLTEAERRYREDFVLEAADLLGRRYLLTDVWARLGVDVEEGEAFARTNEMMRAYRCTIFARVVHTLSQIGLLTPRIREGLRRLELTRGGSPLSGPAG